MTQYAFDLPESHWLRVPLAFPDGDDPDVFAWAARVADDRAQRGSDLHRALAGRATELAAVPGPRDDAAERLWLLPSAESPEAIAHLYFAEGHDGPLDELAIAGTGGGIQSRWAVEGTGFKEALAVQILDEGEVGLLSISRRLGRAGGVVALLEVIDVEPSLASLPGGPLDQLLVGLRVREG